MTTPRRPHETPDVEEPLVDVDVVVLAGGAVIPELRLDGPPGTDRPADFGHRCLDAALEQIRAVTSEAAVPPPPGPSGMNSAPPGERGRVGLHTSQATLPAQVLRGPDTGTGSR